MEPTLRQGDIVLVRKSDLGVIPETIRGIVVGDDSSDGSGSDRFRLQMYEARNGIGEHAPVSRVYDNPPVALNGHVIVYKNPEQGIPSELCVKRAIGVGGQLVRPRTGSGRMQQVPPYSLFLEGDNHTNSRDSRHIGPISKGLLVGIAEYVLWPPTRMGRIERNTPSDEKGRPRASWP